LRAMTKCMFTLPAIAAAILGLTAINGAAGPEDSSRPKEEGIASLYPGDRGIEKDPAVVFAEDFESGALEDLLQRWTSSNNKDRRVLSYVTDSVPGSAGKRSLLITGTKGHDEGGDLWKRLSRGYDQLYARFYVKFAEDAPYVHHFVALGAQRDSMPYPNPQAGSRPDGDKQFYVYMDLGRREGINPPGHWFLYTYWSRMRSFESMEGEGKTFWGNPFGPEQPLQAARGRWQCVEFMIRCNSAPDRSDGEMAFWVDGVKASHWGPGSHTGTWVRDKFFTSGQFNTAPKPFEGFLWRTDEALKINAFWLEYYLASVFGRDLKPSDPSVPYDSEAGRVQFDNIVLATKYIGPVAGAVLGEGKK